MNMNSASTRREEETPIAGHAEQNAIDNGEIVGALNLRDYFAAKAMQVVMESWGRKDSDSWDTCKSTMADISYEFADAMLAAREKGNE